VDGERLVMQSRPKPRYTLEELLAASDYSQPRTPEEREWIDAPPVGHELL
jgi:antitoxin ChpS